MEIKQVQRNKDDNQRKTVVLSIRTTRLISQWMSKNSIMPSKVFDLAINELIAKDNKDK